MFLMQELSSTGKLKFLSEVETVAEEAAQLKSQGVDIIIALSHAGLDVDREVAAAVPDVDVIVGGHSHSFLYTGKLSINETALFIILAQKFSEQGMRY
jgi:5'-nucleotidase